VGDSFFFKTPNNVAFVALLKFKKILNDVSNTDCTVVLIISILVILHELGHFLPAKLF